MGTLKKVLVRPGTPNGAVLIALCDEDNIAVHPVRGNRVFRSATGSDRWANGAAGPGVGGRSRRFLDRLEP
ncbi:hypothetical protein GCM10027436_75370 [Actinophytocola sediminis]